MPIRPVKSKRVRAEADGSSSGLAAAPLAPDLSAALLAHLRRLKPGVTMCPSDLARGLGGPEATWRARMEPIRAAARRLAAAGLIEWTQRGEVIDPLQARGAVRFRLPRR